MLKYLRMGNKRIKIVWWVLIVLTVGTFLGLFVTAFDPRYAQKVTHAVATVNGSPISLAEYTNSYTDQKVAFTRQTGNEPAEQEQRMLEAQAWRTALIQHLVTQQARQAGLKAYDPEIVLQLRSNPPTALAVAPEFQTNGQFDMQKYTQITQNPNMDWSAFEEPVRAQLPGRKLEERLAASLKLSQPELTAYFHDRFDRVALTAVQVPPVTSGNVPAPTDAEIDSAYRRYGSRMSAGARIQLEVLRLDKTYSPEDLRAAREQAQSLADRARKGEDFAALAKDYSEGPGAKQGGVVNRTFSPMDFGPQLAPRMAAMKPGEVTDPIEQNGRVVVLKVLEVVAPPAPGAGPGLKVAQIVIQARQSEGARQKMSEKLDKVRARARTIGLAKAATEAGLTTTKTAYFDPNVGSQELADMPEAVDWAAGAKVGTVSRVFMSQDAFAVVSVADKRPAGVATKAELMDPLRQLAEYHKRTLLAKPAADRIAALLAQGRSLEDAAREAGAMVIKIDSMTRVQPDQRLMAVPEVAGRAFGAPIGRVAGPMETPAGWFFVRTDARSVADTSRFTPELKNQLRSELLQRRQQDFFSSWLAEMRAKANVVDLRGEGQQ
jgi:peptidyl-prolyl cis-trans isomerase D